MIIRNAFLFWILSATGVVFAGSGVPILEPQQALALSKPSAGMTSNQSLLTSLLLKGGNYNQAIDTLLAKEDLATNWEANFWLGTAYLMNGELDAAAEVLDAALEIKGNVAEVWIQRAVIAQERGQSAVALQLLEVAIQLHPENSVAYLNAGYAYENLGYIDAARAAYGQFLRLSTHEAGNASLRRHVLSRLSGLGINKEQS